MSAAKNSSCLEREADATRERLSDTLDELRTRMTPGHMTEEALAYAKSSGYSLVQTLGEAVKANPLPALLIGTGCFMLMRSRGSSNYGPSAGSGVGSSVASGASSAASSVRGAASSVRGSVTSGARRAQAAAEDFSEQVSDTYDSYTEEMNERAREVGDYARRQSRRMGRQLDRGWSFLEEQPLVLAAVGVAVGAALGAALPSTRVEDEYLGETSDHLKERASDLASQQYGQAKAAVSRAADKVMRDAEAEGLSAEGVRAAAKEAGDKVRHVASGAARTLKAEAGLSGGARSGDIGPRRTRG